MNLLQRRSCIWMKHFLNLKVLIGIGIEIFSKSSQNIVVVKYGSYFQISFTLVIFQYFFFIKSP